MAKVEYSNNNIFILMVKYIDGLTLLNIYMILIDPFTEPGQCVTPIRNV